MLYLDHSGVSITIHKDHNELQISNASKGSHHGFHHVVQDLMMHFSSLAELEKWHAALTNVLHPQPQPQPVKQDATARPQAMQHAAPQATASAPAASHHSAVDIAEVNELLAAASIAASEIDDAVAADGSKRNSLLEPAALISASNWMMRAWEMGNEAEYRALTAPEFRMVIYPTYLVFHYPLKTMLATRSLSPTS